MAQVAIEKIDEKKAPTTSVFEDLRELSQRISRRAFEIFEHRGSRAGTALDDWFAAERDLFHIPASELVEKEGKFEATVSAPGFEPGDVKITALPDALIVRAESTHKHDKTEGDVRFCEFGQKSLFRRFELPEPINLDKVTAELDKGVLRLTAFKAAKVAPKQKSVTA
jgi:HSP20 family protein